MIDVFLLVLPVFLVIAIGHLLWRRDFLPDAFWPAAEKLAYFILMPAIIVRTLARGDLGEIDLGGTAGAVFALVGAVTVLMVATRLVVRLPGPSFASMYQGAIRLNGFVGLSIILALFGEAGVARISVVIAVWVPLANLLSIYGFVRATGGRRAGPGQVILQILRNPLVMAVFIGVGANLAGLGPHIDRMPLLDLLGRAGLPLGLLTVGAGLDLASLRAAGGRVLWTTFVKLAVMPAAMTAICLALALDPTSTALMILFSALPTSATGHIPARQLGGDVPLMIGIITLQTALALITMTVAATLLA